jgi:integrase
VARPSEGKWVQGKQFVLPNGDECLYVYLRPNSSIYQYFLSIDGEGVERKSTGKKDLEDAKKVAWNRYLEVQVRQQQGLKARRVKKLFDFIDDFLKKESERIADYNKKDCITKETFRVKCHHLKLLKIFYGNRNVKLEDLDYPKLYEYPSWRRKTKDVGLGISPPKTNHTILSELSTIKAYFQYLERHGYIGRLPTFEKLTRESSRVNRRDHLNPKEYLETIEAIASWANSYGCTPSQRHNRKMLYQAVLVMTNSCLRKGELRGLIWRDLEPNANLSCADQATYHLIRIRKENTKTGVPRTVQSPTSKRFEDIRRLAGISPKSARSSFPRIPSEKLDYPVFSKFNHPDKPLGQGTWDRCWREIREICQDRFWGSKNITWYSFRHTGVSFAVSRGVPMLPLARNCGTGVRYIEDVYYHHEAESKSTWATLNQNRSFREKMELRRTELTIPIEEINDELMEWEFDQEDYNTII